MLRAAERAAVLWKNGGGLTREVAVYPHGTDLASFDWRVSLAEVHHGGPFSIFPQVDRQMAVIAGKLELSITGRSPLTLSPESEPCQFAGDAAVYAAPLQGPVTDLNVMTRRGRFAAHLHRCRAAASVMLPLEADTTLIVALGPFSVRAASLEASLAPLDALCLNAEPYRCVTASSEGAALELWLIEIRAQSQ